MRFGFVTGGSSAQLRHDIRHWEVLEGGQLGAHRSVDQCRRGPGIRLHGVEVHNGTNGRFERVLAEIPVAAPRQAVIAQVGNLRHFGQPDIGYCPNLTRGVLICWSKCPIFLLEKTAKWPN